MGCIIRIFNRAVFERWRNGRKVGKTDVRIVCDTHVYLSRVSRVYKKRKPGQRRDDSLETTTTDRIFQLRFSYSFRGGAKTKTIIKTLRPPAVVKDTNHSTRAVFDSPATLTDDRGNTKRFVRPFRARSPIVCTRAPE